MLELSPWFHGVHPIALHNPELLGKAFHQVLLTCTMPRRESLPRKGGDICFCITEGLTPTVAAVGICGLPRVSLYRGSRAPDQPRGPSNKISRSPRSKERDAITGRVLLCSSLFRSLAISAPPGSTVSR
jgi:hypothetical protein